MEASKKVVVLLARDRVVVADDVELVGGKKGVVCRVMDGQAIVEFDDGANPRWVSIDKLTKEGEISINGKPASTGSGEAKD